MHCLLCGSFIHHSFITSLTEKRIYQCSWSVHRKTYFDATGPDLKQVVPFSVGGGDNPMWEAKNAS